MPDTEAVTLVVGEVASTKVTPFAEVDVHLPMLVLLVPARFVCKLHTARSAPASRLVKLKTMMVIFCAALESQMFFARTKTVSPDELAAKRTTIDVSFDTPTITPLFLAKRQL